MLDRAEILARRVALYGAARQYVRTYEACSGEEITGLIEDERELEGAAARLTEAIGPLVIPEASAEYIGELERRLAAATDRTERFRLQAELEDTEDGHWVGPRTDDPPDSWV
jgi:hypothetical protein